MTATLPRANASGTAALIGDLGRDIAPDRVRVGSAVLSL